MFISNAQYNEDAVKKVVLNVVVVRPADKVMFTFRNPALAES
jgi:hypothetical protein